MREAHHRRCCCLLIVITTSPNLLTSTELIIITIILVGAAYHHFQRPGSTDATNTPAHTSLSHSSLLRTHTPRARVCVLAVCLSVHPQPHLTT